MYRSSQLSSNKENELIHPSAVISEGAEVGKNVKIGAYSVIGSNVKLGDDNIVHPHVVIEGHTTIGDNNEFYQFSSIGANPQDYSYKGEPTRLKIGSNNTFRECVTLNVGTIKQDGLTQIGSGSLFMAYVHMGHDVNVGDNCTIANAVQIAGHVKIGSNAVIGGGTVISQFVTIGRGSFIGGGSAIDHDIPIFCTAIGNRVRLKGINIIGMRRQNISKQHISELVDFLRIMESSSLSPRAFIDHEELMKDFNDNEIVQELVEDIRKTQIGIAPFLS